MPLGRRTPEGVVVETAMDESRIYQGTVAGSSAPLRSAVNTPSGGGFFAPSNLFRMVIFHWKVVLAAVLFGALFGILYLQFTTPVYKAEAELEMNVRRPKVINNEAVFDDSMLRDEDVIFNTRFAKFKSPAMERLATIEYFKTYPDDLITEDGRGIGKYMLAAFIRDVEWNKDPKANIVRVSYYGGNPEFAAKLVNVLSQCAGLLMMQENRAQSDEAVKWLVSQVQEQRESLESVERALSKLREELQLDALEQRKQVLDQTLVSVSAEREILISTLATRQTVFGFVRELQGTDPNLEVLPPGLPKEDQLAELIQTWRAAHEDLLQAADRYTELHPEYRLAAEREVRARKRLDDFINLSAKSVQNEIELLGKQVKQVDTRINSMKDELLDLDQRLAVGMQQVQRLERERDAADTSYQAMLRRMEEARLSADENMAFTKVIREARIPSVPISPKKPSVLVVSVFLGGIAGSVLAVLCAFLTDKVTSISELKALHLNLLGIIPRQKKIDSRSELATLGLRDRFNPIVEAFAGINALISSDKFSSNTRVLQLSSAMPGEGKTIAACNLAISSALNGKRTLLIDGDLRRPQIVNVFAVPEEHPSLLAWLVANSKGAACSELVAQNVIDNLDIVISRPLIEINPAELLGRGGMGELLKWARANYDRVIIDSPPIGAVGDGQVLANYADSVILVSRIGTTMRRTLKFAIERFHEIDVPILGCIANDVSNSLVGMFDGAEGYGHGYGMGYGGYHAYGSK